MIFKHRTALRSAQSALYIYDDWEIESMTDEEMILTIMN